MTSLVLLSFTWQLAKDPSSCKLSRFSTNMCYHRSWFRNNDFLSSQFRFPTLFRTFRALFLCISPKCSIKRELFYALIFLVLHLCVLFLFNCGTATSPTVLPPSPVLL